MDTSHSNGGLHSLALFLLPSTYAMPTNGGHSKRTMTAGSWYNEDMGFDPQDKWILYPFFIFIGCLLLVGIVPSLFA